MSNPANPRPGLREPREPFLTVTELRNGGLQFHADNQDAATPDRVRRLLKLLEWFPLPARHERRMLRPARTERLELADVARHVWGLGVQENRSIDRMWDWQLRLFLRPFGMRPRLLAPPKFLSSPAMLRVIRAQSQLLRSLNPAGLDVEAVSARLARLGLTRDVVEKDVPYEAEVTLAFPVLVEARQLSAAQRADLAALSSALLPLGRLVSLAEVEQVLLDCRSSDAGWLRGYMA